VAPAPYPAKTIAKRTKTKFSNNCAAAIDPCHNPRNNNANAHALFTIRRWLAIITKIDKINASPAAEAAGETRLNQLRFKYKSVNESWKWYMTLYRSSLLFHFSLAISLLGVSSDPDFPAQKGLLRAHGLLILIQVTVLHDAEILIG
jgi:hypothetical protein